MNKKKKNTIGKKEKSVYISLSVDDFACSSLTNYTVTSRRTTCLNVEINWLEIVKLPAQCWRREVNETKCVYICVCVFYFLFWFLFSFRFFEVFVWFLSVRIESLFFPHRSDNQLPIVNSVHKQCWSGFEMFTTTNTLTAIVSNRFCNRFTCAHMWLNSNTLFTQTDFDLHNIYSQ